MIDINQSLICKNGHYLKCFNDKFCPLCGAQTISSCPNCSKKIPYLDMTSIITNYKVPLYCSNCGSPYPWTVTLLENARAIVQEDELLQEEQMAELCKCFPNIICQTPRTDLALIRYKKFVDKATSTTRDALIKLFTGVVTETIIQQLINY